MRRRRAATNFEGMNLRLLSGLLLAGALPFTGGCDRKPAHDAPARHPYIELRDHDGRRLMDMRENAPDAAHFYTVGVVVLPDRDSWVRLGDEALAQLRTDALTRVQALPMVKRAELWTPVADESELSLRGDLEPWRKAQAAHGWDAIALVSGTQLAVQSEKQKPEDRATLHTRMDLLLIDAYREQPVFKAAGFSALPITGYQRGDSETLQGTGEAGWRLADAALASRLNGGGDDREAHHRHHRTSSSDDGDEEFSDAETFWLIYFGVNFVNFLWDILTRRH